jgi:hypothetical protein
MTRRESPPGATGAVVALQPQAAPAELGHAAPLVADLQEPPL